MITLIICYEQIFITTAIARKIYGIIYSKIIHFTVTGFFLNNQLATPKQKKGVVSIFENHIPILGYDS